MERAPSSALIRYGCMYSGADPWFSIKFCQKAFVGSGFCLREDAKRSDGSGAAGLSVVGNGWGSNIVSLLLQCLCVNKEDVINNQKS